MSNQDTKLDSQARSFISNIRDSLFNLEIPITKDMSIKINELAIHSMSLTNDIRMRSNFYNRFFRILNEHGIDKALDYVNY